MQNVIWFRKLVDSTDRLAQRFVLMRGPYSHPEHEATAWRFLAPEEKEHFKLGATPSVEPIRKAFGACQLAVDPDTYEFEPLVPAS